MEELKVVNDNLQNYYGFKKEKLDEMSREDLTKHCLDIQNQLNSYFTAYANYDCFLFQLNFIMNEQVNLIKQQYDVVNKGLKQNLK